MLNILAYFPRRLWKQKLAPGRRHSLLAIDRRPDARVSVTGEGWADWDPNHTFDRNMGRIMPDADMVVWYKPLGGPGLREIIGRPSVPTCMRYNECWWEPWEEIRESGTDWVVCHQPFEVDLVREKCNRHVTFIPHCVEASFCDGVGDRPTDVLLTGVCGADHYPLRTACAEAIRAIPGCRIRKHPGYRIRDREPDAEFGDYMRDLGSSKIAICTSSRHKLSLAKYVEAAASGCLVLGDVPPMNLRLREIIVSIDDLWDGYAIDGDGLRLRIREWLGNEDERRRKAAAGQAIARAEFSQERYAADFVQQAGEFLNAGA